MRDSYHSQCKVAEERNWWGREIYTENGYIMLKRYVMLAMFTSILHASVVFLLFCKHNTVTMLTLAFVSCLIYISAEMNGAREIYEYHEMFCWIHRSIV